MKKKELRNTIRIVNYKNKNGTCYICGNRNVLQPLSGTTFPDGVNILYHAGLPCCDIVDNAKSIIELNRRLAGGK